MSFGWALCAWRASALKRAPGKSDLSGADCARRPLSTGKRCKHRRCASTGSIQSRESFVFWQAPRKYGSGQNRTASTFKPGDHCLRASSASISAGRKRGEHRISGSAAQHGDTLERPEGDRRGLVSRGESGPGDGDPSASGEESRLTFSEEKEERRERVRV